MPRPAPLTTFTISYGGVSLINDPAALTPVFIGYAPSGGILVTSTTLISSGGVITGSQTTSSYIANELIPGAALTYERLGIDPETDLSVEGMSAGLASGGWVTSNPLGMAYYAAIQTGSTDFYVMATSDTTSTATINAMSKAAKSENSYSLVPVVQNAVIVTEGKKIISAYSNPKKAQNKRLWVYAQTNGDSTASDLVAQTISGAQTMRSGNDYPERINYVFAENNTVAGLPCSNAQYIVPVLATMRANTAPHAPLTDVPIPGVSIADSVGFTEDQYKSMNNAGVWVCFKDERGENVTRHAVTTCVDDTIAMEDSAVSNADNIVRTVRSQVSWLRGNCNVTPALIDKIYANVQAAFNSILARNYSALIGPQILEVKSVKVEQDPNDTAGVIGTFDLDLPDVYLYGDFTFNLF